MTLEAKKNNILKMIQSIEHDYVLDEINAKVVEVISKNDILDKYDRELELQIDIEKLANEQNYKGINLEEMINLAREIGIEETTEQLLQMLD